MLEILAEQIKAFKGRDADFVALLRQLLFAEAQKHGLALGGIDVPAQITIPDGGDDGRIEWNAGTDHTDYVPARLTVFQIKATTMPRAKCRAEVVHELTRTLKPAVREALERSGAYIVSCTDACARPGMMERMAGLKEGIENAVDAMTAQNIHFYDANKIAAWVNQYPSVQVWVHEALTGSAMDGLQSWDSWSRNPHLRTNIYNFAPGKTRDGRVDISALLQEVPRDLAQPRTVVRMVGLSGLGKTRIALEMFRPPPEPKATTIAPLNASVTVRKLLSWRQPHLQDLFPVETGQAALDICC